MNVLAIIPARGGSKSMPGKNLVPFLGKPLLAWSVEAALKSRLVTRTIVSTDDAAIVAAADAAGAETPFVRPAELAEDHVRDLPVFVHALAWLQENEGYSPDLVVQLRPTSPLRPDGLIDEAVELLIANPDAHSLRAVCEPPCNPYKMWRIEHERLVPLVDSGIPQQHDALRQALPQVFWQIGTIDVIRTETITKRASMSGDVIVPLVVDANLAADIDDQLSLDWAVQLAERIGLAEGRS